MRRLVSSIFSPGNCRASFTRRAAIILTISQLARSVIEENGDEAIQIVNVISGLGGNANYVGLAVAIEIGHAHVAGNRPHVIGRRCGEGAATIVFGDRNCAGLLVIDI